MSSRKKRTGPGLSSYVGLVRFYEEVEEQVKLNPYLIISIAIATSVIVILLKIFVPKP
ncbi:Sec61beta [Ignisphaera aggregans DSM 17230]|uniref:Preprotein translocase subunit SecG n=1 Tax=Ignisphaera aggregans (strain DSM 17230 / JCM 13409 / AQ1.S1) TaxID=583356 RepID=E0SPG6_IGNAA|nr:Sec61beta [Ignisphaera aggregans DSM 17230]